MKKNLFAILMASALAFTACDSNEPNGDEDNLVPDEPRTGTIPFTYAEGALFNYGKGKKETIDVAICLENEALVGKKLSGLKAYIATAEGISDISLWGTKELSLEANVNVPDMFSYNVTPVETAVGSSILQQIEVTFDSPIDLTDEPIYVGYTINVEENTTDAQKNPLVLADNQAPGGLYVHMSKSVFKWMDYTATANGVAYIVAEIEGEYQPYSLSVATSDEIFANDNENFEGVFYLSNRGLEDISSLSYTYTYDASNFQYTGSYELPEPVAPSYLSTTPVTLPFQAITGAGSHVLNLKITKVNNHANVAEGAEYKTVVNVKPFQPVHRPLVEEFTGLWCQWCPRGFLAMEEISKVYGDSQVSICYHIQDAITNFSSLPPLYNEGINYGGLPGATVDRITSLDPYTGSTSSKDFGIFDNIDNAMATEAIASINVKAALEGQTVKVYTDYTFIQDFNDANFQLGYVLICDGLTKSTWQQVNAYAGSPLYKGTPLEVLTTWGNPVTGLVFNDVAVNIDARDGVAGSVPKAITTGENYNNEYTYDISTIKVIQDVNNMKVAAFIIDKNTNKIINANKCKVVIAE